MAGERVIHTRRADVEAYITKDGSVIRELMHPNVHGNANASIAEAIVAPGQSTYLHKYMQTIIPRPSPTHFLSAICVWYSQTPQI